MNRLLLGMLLMPLGLGCVDLGHVHSTSERPVTPRAAIAAPVTADQVTPANARRVAESLQNEIDRDDLPLAAPSEKRR